MTGGKNTMKNKGNGNMRGKNKKKGKKDMSICLLFEALDRRIVVSIDIDTTATAAEGGLNMHVSRSLQFQAGSTAGVGFTALGSKIYVVGGDVHPKTRRYPKEVYVFDFENPLLQWEKGPFLEGAKPNPLVFTVNEKIYALAGPTYGIQKEILDNVFEVLNPRGHNYWKTLPNPPFHSFYNTNDGIQLRGHTVIGFNIYVNVLKPSGNVSLYSFNVKKEKWKLHNEPLIGSFNVHNHNASYCGAASGSDDIIFHNLRTLYELDYGSDVVDYLLYQTDVRNPGKGVKVFALDLTTSREDEKIPWEIDEENFIASFVRANFELQDYCYPADGHLVTVPVLGLNHVTDTIPGTPGTKGFVTHLRDNMFCFVCHYHFKRITHLRACMFEVTSVEVSKGSKFITQFLVAGNVKEHDWILDPEIQKTSLLTTWCKIPNKGRQIHFRRRQFQIDGKADSYQDDVAGKVVRKRLDDHVIQLEVNQPYEGGPIKLNTDGCWNKDNHKAGFGGLFRDSNGKWMLGYYGKLASKSILIAELWAIYRGLTIIQEENMKNVTIESDSSLAVNLINEGTPGDHAGDHAQGIIKDAHALLAHTETKLAHIYRGANKCADHLARVGAEQEEDLVIATVMPISIMEFMIREPKH